MKKLQILFDRASAAFLVFVLVPGTLCHSHGPDQILLSDFIRLVNFI